MESELDKIVRKGKYYYPAYLHYGKYTIVSCDRCGQKNLLACIGYEEHDLCLGCVETMVNKIPQKPLPEMPFSFPSHPSYPSHPSEIPRYSPSFKFLPPHSCNNVIEPPEIPEIPGKKHSSPHF